MKLVLTIPLLLTATGAFFLLASNYFPIIFCIILLLILMTAFFKPQNSISLLKNVSVMSLFIFPILIGKILTAKEGLLIHLAGLKIYSLGIEEALKSWSIILLLGIISFIVFRILYPLEQYKKFLGRWKIFSILFLSLEIYQELLKKIGILFRKDEKTVLEKIDQWYNESR